VRLHTNYPYHREAALRALGVAATRDAVERTVLASGAEAVESAVVAEGGCAARSRTAAEWAEHPQGVAVAGEPVFAVTTWPAPSLDVGPAGARGPLGGVRVLDLTRVLAGPLCTRVLAAFGADVMRVDPKGFEEVSALVPETSAGKRRTRLDLRNEPCRAAFEQLLAGAHVLVHGYRSDALDRLGLGAAWRRAVNPSLVEVSLDAYGFGGPWAARRGFDSLVQMSAGIADRGRAVMGTDRPHPLPAQALDHATGYLMAASVCRALVRAITDGTASATRLSLARVAKLLTDLGDGGDPKAPEVSREEIARWTESAPSAFGTIWRVRCPVVVDGIESRLAIAPGPLGVDRPVW
jgi:hypothetical protein